MGTTVYRRPYLSFCPITLQHQFQVLMSMQMDALKKKRADDYPFCPVGVTGREVWGGGGQGCPACAFLQK